MLNIQETRSCWAMYFRFSTQADAGTGWFAGAGADCHRDQAHFAGGLIKPATIGLICPQCIIPGSATICRTPCSPIPDNIQHQQGSEAMGKLATEAMPYLEVWNVQEI